MTLSSMAKIAEKFVIDNSPSILTAIGVTGSITTAYLTGKASYQAAHIIRDEEFRRHEIVGKKERLKMVWDLYIPAVGVGTLSVAAIIGANRIGARRAAAIAAAYSVSERAFTEYREKVAEQLGQKKEQVVRDAIAQDKVTSNPPDKEIVIVEGEVLCHDGYTGRYFKSNMESLKKAQNDLNYQVLNNYYASLTDFYNLIGLARTTYSDEVGWNVDKLLDLDFSTVLSEDGKPCISINFAVVPVRDYYRIR